MIKGIPSLSKVCEIGSPLIHCAGMSVDEAKNEQVAFHIILDKRATCADVPEEYPTKE
jgi:hypothetical protein